MIPWIEHAIRSAITTALTPPQRQPPIGVRVYRPDTDTETLCELIHIGMHEDIDRWEIAGIRFRRGDELRIDHLPARTSIGFRAAYTEDRG
jgi:hypothetical protein